MYIYNPSRIYRSLPKFKERTKPLTFAQYDHHEKWVAPFDPSVISPVYFGYRYTRKMQARDPLEAWQRKLCVGGHIKVKTLFKH